MNFYIITLFPEIFSSYLNESILGRAIKNNKISINFYNPRDYTEPTEKQKKNDKPYVRVDDKPYGGGAGMVLQAEPILKAYSDVEKTLKSKKKKVVIFSAKGKQFDQKLAYTWAKKYEEIVFITGRYEGIDERVRIALKAEEVSIGPYVLTDGDIAASVVISAVARLVPGVIRLESLKEESHWNLILKKESQGTLGENGLEYPHYTHPEVIAYKGKKYRVPKVLLSGNHAEINAWRSRGKN